MKSLAVSGIILCILIWIAGCSGKRNAGDHEGAALKESRVLDSIANLTHTSFAWRAINMDSSLFYAQKALELGNKNQLGEGICLAYVAVADAFTTSHKDSSFIYNTRAMQIAENLNLADQKCQVLYNLAMLYADAEDLKTSVVLLDSLSRMLAAHPNYPLLSDTYNALGSIYNELNDTSMARHMFDSAFHVAQRNSLYHQLGISLGNLAAFSSDQNENILLLKKAAMNLRSARGTEEELAQLLINIGLLQEDPDSALYYYRRAIGIAVNTKLELVELGAYNNMVYSYLDKGDPENAEKCLTVYALPIAERTRNYDWLVTLYDTYSDVLAAKHDYKEALAKQKLAAEARDQKDLARQAEQTRLLASILNVKNKENLIKTQQGALVQQKNRLLVLRSWLLLFVLFTAVLGMIILWVRQRNRSRLQSIRLESARRIIELEEHRKEAIGRELHDTIGHLIHALAGYVSDIDIPDAALKSGISTKLKELGNGIRRISHRLNRVMMEQSLFQELLTNLCEDYRSLAKLDLHYYIPARLPDMDKESILHSYRIVEELLNNAAKYAPGSKITLKIAVTGKTLLIFYDDNGAGFDMNSATPGMGLKNISERIRLLEGHHEMTTSPGRGLSWEITIPV
jgi:two-component system, NarL family, sensor kinase